MAHNGTVRRRWSDARRSNNHNETGRRIGPRRQLALTTSKTTTTTSTTSTTTVERRNTIKRDERERVSFGLYQDPGLGEVWRHYI